MPNLVILTKTTYDLIRKKNAKHKLKDDNSKIILEKSKIESVMLLLVHHVQNCRHVIVLLLKDIMMTAIAQIYKALPLLETTFFSIYNIKAQIFKHYLFTFVQEKKKTKQTKVELD